MTKIKDLLPVVQDDDFTAEERPSTALDEFSDVWKTSANSVLGSIQDDTLQILGEIDPEVASIFKEMLSYLSLAFLADTTIDDFDYLSDSDDFFLLWRKWHPRPQSGD